jgi:hypothetical protein
MGTTNGPDGALPGQMTLPLTAPAPPAQPPSAPPTVPTVSDDDDEPPPLPSCTLEEARQWLQGHLAVGVSCPCCTQFAKIYKRPMTGTMAYALVLIYRHFRSATVGSWLHVPTFLTAQSGLGPVARGGDWAKLVYWGLIRDKGDVRDDGSNRAGYYQITDHGCQFVECKVRVPKYVWIYDGQALTRTEEPELVSIRDVMGTKFDYSELMRPA